MFLEFHIFTSFLTSRFSDSRQPERGGLETRDVRGGAFSSGAGRGKDENPRGGPGRGGAKKRVNQLIQNLDKSA